MINANIDILKMKTLFQERIKKIKTITVLIRKKVTSKIPNRKFTPNNHNNRLVGPPRVKSLDGHAPSYSTMQIRTLKLLANVNSENDDNNKVIVENNVLTNRDNNSWMFDNNSSTSNNSQARICTFNYPSRSSSSSSSTSTSPTLTYEQRTAHIWDYDIVQLHMEQEMISKQQKESASTSDTRLLHTQSLNFELICSLPTPPSLWPDTSSDHRTPVHSQC